MRGKWEIFFCFDENEIIQNVEIEEEDITISRW